MFAESLFNQDIERWEIYNISSLTDMFLDSSYSFNLYEWVKKVPEISLGLPDKLVNYDFSLKWIEYGSK